MKTLILDIETAPNIADVWGLWNNNVSLNQLRQSSYILCWAAKWHGKKEIYFCSKWCDESDDYIRWMWQLLDEADAVVTYNGDAFDLPTLNREFLFQGLGPTSPYNSIDLYKSVKKKFKFPSYKLDYVCQELGIGKKLKHQGHELWVKTMAGDPKAQKLMERYCKNDVYPMTEKLYNTLLPWIPGHPNRMLYVGGDCVRCAKGSLVKRGFYYTASGKYQTYRCNNCGGYQRDTRRTDGIDQRSQD